MTDLLDPDDVLQEVARVAFSDVGELFDEHGHLRAIDELPDHVVAAIASIEIVRRRRPAEQHATVVVRKRGSMPDGHIRPTRYKDVEADRTTMTDGPAAPLLARTMNRGWLKHGNTPGDPSKARRCGARARTRGNQPCRAPAIKGKRRCRMHGGRSTGPQTLEGCERSKRARWKHGSYSVEAEREFRRLKAEYAAFNAMQRARHAVLLAGMRLLLKRDRTELRNARRRHRHRTRD